MGRSGFTVFTSTVEVFWSASEYMQQTSQADDNFWTKIYSQDKGKVVRATLGIKLWYQSNGTCIEYIQARHFKDHLGFSFNFQGLQVGI